jgi:prevent-host-death family protein
MKTITAQQAGQEFEKFAKIANSGERIVVTHNGQPWVVLQPPPRAKHAPLAGRWPDYPAHWRQHFANGFARGPTATELLAQDKADRF